MKKESPSAVILDLKKHLLRIKDVFLEIIAEESGKKKEREGFDSLSSPGQGMPGFSGTHGNTRKHTTRNFLLKGSDSCSGFI